jgi:phosphate transport system substrate-binding protein
MRVIRMAIAVIAGCMTTLTGAPLLAAEAVIVNGSTTVLPIAQAAAEAFTKENPGVDLSLSNGGSGNGIRALMDRTAQIAMSSREMKKEEIDLARSKGVNPVEYPIARDAVTPIVHPSNPVNNLSMDQLSLIYQGMIRNWKDVGGENLQIVVISRDTSSGTYEIWQEKVLHNRKVSPRAQLQASNGTVVEAVSTSRYAIGYVGMGYVNASVKALSVNGIAANHANARHGTYPIARDLYFYTDGPPKGAAEAFLKFVTGEEGQKIVAKEGFVPLRVIR